MKDRELAERIRAFNRLYTQAIGSLDDRHEGLDVTLAQSRVLFTIRSMEAPQVNQIADSQSETMKQLFIEKEKTKAQIFAILTPEQRAEAAKMKDAFKERFKGKFNKRFGGKEDNPATEE